MGYSKLCFDVYEIVYFFLFIQFNADLDTNIIHILLQNQIILLLLCILNSFVF